MNAPNGNANAAEGDQPKRRLNPVVETVLIVAAALLFAFVIQWALVKPYKIPSASMVPTLVEGQRVLVNRIDGRFGTPQRGEVIVFHPPPGADEQLCGISDGETFGPDDERYIAPGSPESYEEDGEESAMACPVAQAGAQQQAFIKRLVGMPGDRFKLIKGEVWINGKRLDEPYINQYPSCADPALAVIGCTFAREFTIPPGMYYFLGDNRARSDDSRYWGPIPQENLIGKAFATYWPPKRIGGV